MKLEGEWDEKAQTLPKTLPKLTEDRENYWENMVETGSLFGLKTQRWELRFLQNSSWFVSSNRWDKSWETHGSCPGWALHQGTHHAWLPLPEPALKMPPLQTSFEDTHQMQGMQSHLMPQWPWGSQSWALGTVVPESQASGVLGAPSLASLASSALLHLLLWLSANSFVCCWWAKR